nr:DUF2807 domain-containing protein [Acidiferrobacterales bacterium]
MFFKLNFKFSLPLLIALLVMVNAGRALAKEELALEGFTDISIMTPYNLYVQQGDDFKVVVEASGNAAEYLETYVKNDTLHLEIKRHTKSRDMRGNVEYHVTLPNLKNIKLIGSGDVIIDKITSKKLHLSVQGSGDISLDGFTGVDLIAKLHGSGDISMDR